MVFSSPIFLFVFLPFVLLGAFLSGKRFGNVFLLAASTLFYAWGEPVYVILLLVSILGNYAGGRLIAAASGRSPKLGNTALGLGVAFNLGLLGFFKYANLIVDTANALAGKERLHLGEIPLPIGISFFTFQALSYLIDVRRGVVPPQRSLIKLALYISMFPQLIAGPIVRYDWIAGQLDDHPVTLAAFGSGIRRFIIGFAKKVMIADSMGVVADQVFALPPEQCSATLVWTALLAYTLQIYFDFSGYSDMAIGLGRMFGFEFPENFNYPYISQNIREFWRRWHMTLSGWFRDFLYIPLGGNRKGALRTSVNLFAVFALCGLWHGASWSFLVWGLFHGFFLSLERSFIGRLLDRSWRPFRHLYTLLVVMAGWLFFRIEDIGLAGRFLLVLAGFEGAGDVNFNPVRIYTNTETWIIMAAGVTGATPLCTWFAGRIAQRFGTTRRMEILRYTSLYLLFILAVLFMASSTHSPFLYFRF